MGVLLKSPSGETHDVPADQVEQYRGLGYEPVSSQERSAQVTQGAVDARANERGVIGGINAGVSGALSGLTLGTSDIIARGLMTDEEFDRVRAEREAHPYITTGAGIVGAIAPTILSGGAGAGAAAARLAPAALASRAGAAIARTAEGAGAIAKVGRSLAGGAVEGAIFGAGDAASQLALSNDPLTVERVASTITSNMLFGGAIGGAAGGLGKLAELGLSKAKGVIDAAAASGPARLEATVGQDLAGLDAKGLRAAQEAEKASYKTAHADELASIETQRVAQRKDLADELVAFRREVKANKEFLTTKDIDLPASGELLGSKEIGAKARKANKTLDNLFDDPKGIAARPEIALKALRVQEDAYVKLLERGNDLRTLYAAEGAGTSRATALDTVASSLEKNRALQARIETLTTKPTSAKLEQLATANAARTAAIEDARDALIAGASKPKSFVEKMASGAVFSGVVGAVGAIPGIGHLAAPFLGAKAAEFVGEKVFGRLAKAGGEVAARSAKAAGAFVDIARKATPYAPVLATKVLSAVAFSPDAPAKEPPRGTHREKLAPLYKARSEEIRQQVSAGPDGRAVMRPEARAAIADRLSPINAFSPLLGDRIETLAARRIEFLADKLPKRPDVAGMPIGPDRWQPSELEMRKWARYVAAVEDPGGVEERLADGTVTPEDAEVMREVYPERMADITRQIVEKLPTLRASLPYQRRLALSIFSGVPVDAAMDPRILAVLQSTFTSEPGSAGGAMAPRATPQFGSVRSADKATPAQQRAQGAA